LVNEIGLGQIVGRDRRPINEMIEVGEGEAK